MNLQDFTLKWSSSPRHRYCGLCGKFIDEHSQLARRYVVDLGEKRLADPREFICNVCAVDKCGLSASKLISKQESFSFPESPEPCEQINPTPMNRHGLDPADLYHEDEPLAEKPLKNESIPNKDKSSSEPPPWD